MSGNRLEHGQVAVVTGAATGIGFALAKAFCRRGLRVVLADNNEVMLSASVDALASTGAEVLGIVTDVSQRESVSELSRSTFDAFGRVDVLVNNAGIFNKVMPVWEQPLDAWRRLQETNYWGVIHGIQEFVPHLIAQGSGIVVNTASMSGLSTVPGMADYSSVKHAVIALSEILRADLDLAGHQNIGVTLLCPAIVQTDMGRRSLGLLNSPDEAGGRKAIGSGPDLSAVLDVDEFAEVAVAGVAAGHRYVTPTPRSRDRFLARIQPILDSFDNYPASHGNR